MSDGSGGETMVGHAVDARDALESVVTTALNKYDGGDDQHSHEYEVAASLANIATAMLSLMIMFGPEIRAAAERWDELHP